MTAITLDIGGMTCAACSARIEKVLARTPGLESVSVNLALERADIKAGDGIDPETLIKVVERAGYTAVLRVADRKAQQAADDLRAAQKRADERLTFLRFAVSAALSLPLLIANLPMMLGTGHSLIGAGWQAALAGGVMLVSGSKFWREAWHALRTGGANMAVLVSLGTGVAYAWSAWQAWTGHGHEHLYFEAAAIVLTLVMLGKWLESRAKTGASAALSALAKLRPKTAERVNGETTETIDAETLAPDDVVRVLPGGKIPCDGEIITGQTSVDEALVTGESLPVFRREGDAVITGTVNIDGRIDIRVTRVGEDTRLARIIRMVEQAQVGEAPVQKLADQVSAIFVPAILVLAALTFAGWWLWTGEAVSGLAPAISVLVIACPCALGLATPTALVAGAGAAARAGILIRDIETLDKAHAIGAVAFDKTGTLTLGKPAVTGSVAAGRADFIELAAAVEAGSEHPLARAIGIHAAGRDIPKAENLRVTPGQGASGIVSGEAVHVGNARFMAARGAGEPEMAALSAQLETAGTLAFVMAGGRLAGVFSIADALRPEAKAAIARLGASHLPTLMITGDNEAAARAIAAKAGIGDVLSGVAPEGKVAAIRAFREKSGVAVAFVGDGLNDGPALAAADLGIAMASGADVAREAAAVTLMRPDLHLVGDALDIARKTRRTILQNLAWAFGYNVVGIPLAAFGVLSPVFAGAAMAFSSVSVVTNSALLARWKPSRR